jgi:predicted RNA-binding Zn ribbon-like protein
MVMGQVDFSHYNDQPVQMAVDLVNTFDVVASEEKLVAPSDVSRFVDEGEADWCRPGWEPSERDLHEVRALRSRLRSVFDSKSDAAAAEILNEILRDVVAVPRVSVHGAGPHLHFEAAGGSPARWLGAITAMGLTTALIEGGFDRFGTCDSATCDDVYVDTSRNKSRRNCSEKCTTRENVAAYRSRQKV